MLEFITRQLFLTVLSLSLSGALIGIMIAAVHPMTGKYLSKKWNYYIWLLVVVRLLLPFHFESGFLKPLNFQAAFGPNHTPAQSGSTIQNNDRKQIRGTEQSDDTQQPELADTDRSAAVTDASADAAALISDGNTTAAQPNGHQTALSQSGTNLSAAKPQEAKRLGKELSAAGLWTASAYIWFIGAVIAALIKLLNYRHFKSEIRKSCARIADYRIIAMESAFCTRLHIQKIPAIYESTAVASPMTIGLWNPVIVIPKVFSDTSAPASLCAEQNLTHLQLVLHHELIHVARKDLLYKWIYQLLLCVHWFNPVLYRIGRQINCDCELSCDEAILAELTDSGKQLYGNILLDTAGQNIAGMQTAFSTTLLENKKNLKKRLDGILHYKKATRFRLMVSACALLIMLTVSACSTVWISADDTPAPESQHSSSSEPKTADSDESGVLMTVLTSLVSRDNFLDTFARPDRSSDAWKVYDDDGLLTGDDIQDNWGAYNYMGGNNKITASGFVLYGSNSFLIAYAEKEVDVRIRSSFDTVEGNFKIVYIAPDQSILTLNDTGAETTQTITMQEGRNVLKVVGQGAKLTNLEIDYSNLKSWNFANIYYSEDEEYAMQLKNTFIAGEPINKDKIMNTLYHMDAKDASDIFNILLTAGTQFTAEELCDFFIYSDETLSGQYLLEALREGNIDPLSADAISELMPYLPGDCQAELLKSLPVEDFYDAFTENIVYLNDQQIAECLTDYLDRGGVLTFSMYEEISPYVNRNIIKTLDRQLPDLPKLP